MRISRSLCAKSQRCLSEPSKCAGMPPPPTRPPPALEDLHYAQKAVNIYVSIYIRGRPAERRSNAAFIFDLPLTRLAEASTLLLLLRCQAGCRPPTSHMCGSPLIPSRFHPPPGPGEPPSLKFPLLSDTMHQGAAAFQRQQDERVE